MKKRARIRTSGGTTTAKAAAASAARRAAWSAAALLLVGTAAATSPTAAPSAAGTTTQPSPSPADPVAAPTDPPTPGPITPAPTPEPCRLGPSAGGGAGTCPTATHPSPSLQFCLLPVGACQSGSAWDGACAPIPRSCPPGDNKAGVCGCDGRNYASACVAHSEGENVAHAGRCETPAPTDQPSLPPVTNAPTTDAPTTDAPTTRRPTEPPSDAPVAATAAPATAAPAKPPSDAPTNEPTDAPSPSPPVTDAPATAAPTTHGPTDAPSSDAPTRQPSSDPTKKPTQEPTDEPTESPTDEPTTPAPSGSPIEAPTTAAPTRQPTLSPTKRPTEGPTQSPSDDPTLMPSEGPTRKPTQKPTKRPTNRPTQTPTEFPSGSPTPRPTRAPAPGTAPPTTSLAPTLSPTDRPTKQPTKKPTLSPTLTPTESPSVTPTTAAPSGSPTKEPSKAPIIGTLPPTQSKSPTEYPTDNPTATPTTGAPTAAEATPSPTEAPATAEPTTYEPTASPPAEEREATTAGLTIVLGGISSIEDEGEWEEKTERFFEDVYDNDEESGVVDADVEVKITAVEETRRAQRRRLNVRTEDASRGLQSTDSSLEITYTQITKYRSENSELTINEIVVFPLSSQPLRDEYVGELKQLSGYEQLTEVSEISITSDGNEVVAPPPSPDDGGGGGLGLGAIIGIAAGGSAFLILSFAGFVYYRYKKDGEDEDVGDPNATSTIPSSTQDARPPRFQQQGTDISLPTYGSGSVATVDYDYSRAFGGAGAHSLSDAGGTLGSRTRQTAAEDVASGLTSGSPSMRDPRGTGGSIFSDDPTFDQAYEDVREELLDVYAPAGKLGVVIDTPDDGAPVVHAVKDTSPIAERVQVGDKLVAVDDEDVRAMTAIKVSKLISRKSNNASRKLTIIRHVANK